MITRYKPQSTIPYSLHDMRVVKMELVDNNLKLYFENGYVECKEPYPQVDGNLTIEGIDVDLFATVYFLSKNGREGGFRGKKMPLTEFLDKYGNFVSYEINDELYGYNQVHYSGWLLLPDAKDFIEMDMQMYFEGDIVYDVRKNRNV